MKESTEHTYIKTCCLTGKNRNTATQHKQQKHSTLLLKDIFLTLKNFLIMKNNFTTAFTTINSINEAPLTEEDSKKNIEYQEKPSSKIIKMSNLSNLNKDTANELYLSENATPLMEEGFNDACKTDCNTSTFGSKLELIRSKYLNWCRSHQDLFTDRHHEIMDEYKTFIQRCKNKLVGMDDEINGMEEKASALRTEIQLVTSRNYKAVDIIKVFLNIVVMLALGIWCALYYGSAFTLTQISAPDIIDQTTGEIIQLFSFQNMMKGWQLALFPLAAGTIAGFLRKNTWSFIAEMSTFLAMDVFLSLTVEQKIGQAFMIMDIPYTFDWNRFLLIIMYGFVSSLFFCESSYRLGQNLLLNEYNTKRTAAKEGGIRLQKLEERLAALRKERNAVDEDRLSAENNLKRFEEKEMNVYWYDGDTLEGLFNSYYDGWTKFLTSCPNNNCEYAEKMLQITKETIRKTVEK